MQAIGDEISRDKRLVVLLGSLPEEHNQISKIIENMPCMDLFQAKEMLRREFESMMRQEKTEVALKAITKSRKSRFGRKKGKFEGKCFACNRFGHKREDCWKNQRVHEDKKEQAFTVCHSMDGGRLLDSGASSHMCPYEEEFNDI
uniref:AlNc14C518G12025 protein n=1 Tax=Albugo laibachii Nc14 TaxID=890382 RepID=F0X0T1_9STRA|nr:AlNc14C518G12025 [Albugo laibachii Nc14]|eukprot:CCA27375.1 AlNc14C518G12025 [Albugo laibachii Nc14]